jgi:hypothetical protein
VVSLYAGRRLRLRVYDAELPRRWRVERLLLLRRVPDVLRAGAHPRRARGHLPIRVLFPRRLLLCAGFKRRGAVSRADPDPAGRFGHVSNGLSFNELLLWDVGRLLRRLCPSELTSPPHVPGPVAAPSVEGSASLRAVDAPARRERERQQVERRQT